MLRAFLNGLNTREYPMAHTRIYPDGGNPNSSIANRATKPVGILWFNETPSVNIADNGTNSSSPEYLAQSALYRLVRLNPVVSTIATARPTFAPNVAAGFGSALYYLPLSDELDYGKLCQISRLARSYMAGYDGQCDADQIEIKLPELVDMFFGAVDEIGIGIDTATLKRLIKSGFTPHSASDNRWSVSGVNADRIERDYNTFKMLLDYLNVWSSSCLSGRNITRKVYRNAKKLAEGWGLEAMMAMGNHASHGNIFTLRRKDQEFYKRMVRIVGEYYELRGSRLDQGDQPHALLNPSDPVSSSFRLYTERIIQVSENLNTDSSMRTDTSFIEGGEAVTYCDYKINVKMAYYICAKIFGRILQARKEGNPHTNFNGMIWKPGVSVRNSALPVVHGPGVIKYYNTIDMVEQCIKLIIEHPPIGVEGGGHTASLGQHADVSGNLAINSALSICSECSVVSPVGGLITQGTPIKGKTVDLLGRTELDQCVCMTCYGRRFVYAIDVDAFVPAIATEVITVGTYNSRGQRTGNRREVRITLRTRDEIRDRWSQCSHCGNATARGRALVPGTLDPRAELFVTTIFGTDTQQPGVALPETELGMRFRFSQGNITSPVGFAVGTSVDIWDGSTARSVCTQCFDLSSLYLDSATNKYYSNVDASPSAPEYGYKPEDASGRFLPRVIGIEFETGPGSACVPDKDSFLNSRCSDGLHVWNIHTDGSLMGGSCEITTPPVGGLAIPMAVNAVFELAKGRFQIENRSAGMHIHTDITDLFMIMLPIHQQWHSILRSVGSKDPRLKLYSDFAALFGNFGDALSQLSRKFVSAFRRHNSYCAGGFGIRSWSVSEDDPLAKYQSPLTAGGRTAVCIHQHNGYSKRKCVTYTLENRIWPSSNSKEYTLARCELTQKAVDMFCQVAKQVLTGGDLDPLRSFISTFSRLNELDVHLLVPSVCDTLHISPEGRAGLDKLHRRYFWVSYYAHEHNLSMSSQQIRDLISSSMAGMGVKSSDLGSADMRAEVAGIMAQKGFLPSQDSNVTYTLGDSSRMVVMDTLISSLNGDPVATDQSDLQTFTSLSSPVLTNH